MKLVGYKKDEKEIAFREPIYSDNKGVLYHHIVDNRHNITAFETIAIDDADYFKIYISKKFNIGAKAAIVFVGKENYLHYNDAPNAIVEIIHYLNNHSALYNVDGILDQSMLLKNRIFSDHFVVDSFVIKMKPDDEQIVLSFDFPSPNKISDTKSDTADKDTIITPKSKTVDKSNDKEAVFFNAIKHLNSADMNSELKLKLREEERRSKLKTFNYQFKLNQNNSRRKKTTR
jgi:hypothetical protein